MVLLAARFAARSWSAAAWFASRSGTAAWFSSAGSRSSTGHFSSTAAWFASRSTASWLAALVEQAFELVAEAMLLAARSRSAAAWFASRSTAGRLWSTAAWFAARTAAMVTAPEMERLGVATSSGNQTNNENDATNHGQLLKWKLENGTSAVLLGGQHAH